MSGALRARVRSACAAVGPLDRAIRAIRRTDVLADLRRQIAEATTRPEGPAPGPGPDPRPAVADSVAPFVTWSAPGHFYSPVPDLAEIGADADRVFAARVAIPGVDLREDAQVETFREFAALAREAPLPERSGPGSRYGLDNPNYGIGDASMLQAMLRRLRPGRYLEVGSGWSTALALDTNERFLGGEMAVTAVEPHPGLLLERLRPGDPVEVLAERVQRVPLGRFSELRANDVLFVDSSHVLKTGSDVEFLLGEVLPILAPGVHVHIHDVFWPFEYLRHWVEEGRAWNECYAVRAFLAFNSSFEVVLFNHWLALNRRDVIAAELPEMLENTGGALWLRRT
ncbi:MAG: class I SAM-dependent methyltransferase [Actinomycetota bacterium]|nr:class I SAM-dependent methyltransferase [Actinomycetota bacterium]